MDGAEERGHFNQVQAEAPQHLNISAYAFYVRGASGGRGENHRLYTVRVMAWVKQQPGGWGARALNTDKIADKRSCGEGRPDGSQRGRQRKHLTGL